MGEEPRFDLVILGYRNDLSRARVIEMASYLPSQPECCGPLTSSTPVPHVFYKDLDSQTGLSLSTQLREEGAIVRLVALETPSLEPPTTPAEPQPGGRLRMLVTLLVLTVITAALYFGAPELGLHPTSRLGLRRLNDEAVALSEAGEHAEAERRLRTALQHSPGEDVLRQNLQVVLANWAIAELNAGQTAEAVRLAEAALELGEGAHVMSILGMAYVEDGDWANAKWALERAVELGESRPDTLTALGKVYRRQGDREGAVAMFQTARERGATGENFDTMLERLERELDSEWGFAERVSPHFSIAFEEGENFRAARFVLESLEEAYEAVGHRLGHYPAERIPVVLYAKEEFHDVTKTPDWAGGIYDGRIKLPVHGLDARTPLLDRTLRHEYGHVVVAERTRGRCPAWLSEGLAMWVEDRPEDEALSWAHEILSRHAAIPFEKMIGPFLHLPAQQAHVAYAQSYLALRALVHSYGEREILTLLDGLGEGTPFDEAFYGSFRADFADFEAELLRDWEG